MAGRSTVTAREPDTLWVRFADSRQVGEESLPLLDPVERARYDRSSPTSARRFLTATTLARQTVSRLTGVRPKAVPLTRACVRCGSTGGDHGRPVVDRGPHLSWAYAGSRITLAVTRRYQVGVDAERLGRRFDLEVFAAGALSEAESRWWRSRPVTCRERAFLGLWTLKEAIAKAEGRGLTYPARNIDVFGRYAGARPTALSVASGAGHVTSVIVLGPVGAVDVAWTEGPNCRPRPFEPARQREKRNHW